MRLWIDARRLGLARRPALRWRGPLPRRLWVVAVLAAGCLFGAVRFRVAHTLQVRATIPALMGKIIVIDPGHGGRDPGAVVGGVREKDITLAIALHLRDLLLQAGATPVLTREADTDLTDRALPGYGTLGRGELAARVQMVTEHKAHVFVSIHANKLGVNTPWRGAQVFYDPRGKPEGQTLARMLQEELREQTGTRRTALAIEQFVLALAPVPAATVEVGFLSNPEEARRLQDPGYQRQLAYAIFAGLARFLAGQPGTARAS